MAAATTLVAARLRAFLTLAAVPLLSAFTGSGVTADSCVRVRFETAPEMIDVNVRTRITTTLSRGLAEECDSSIDGLAVTASMPQHGHGLPTRPVTEPLPDAKTFVTEGVVFHMPGSWKLHFDVRSAGIIRRVTVEIEVPTRKHLSESERAVILTLSPMPPTPRDPTNRFDGDPKAEVIGRRLFSEQKLGGKQSQTCASCHRPAKGWADGLPAPYAGARNTMSLFNVAHQRWLMWDGSADSLWSQAILPMLNIRELGLDGFMAHRLLCSVEYRDEVRALDPDLVSCTGITSEQDAQSAIVTIAKLVAAYVREIRSPESKFDRFVRDIAANRDSEVLSPGELAGMRLFIGRAQCIACHNGPLFTDYEFHDLGIPEIDDTGWRDSGRRDGVLKLLSSPFNGRSSFSDDATGVKAQWLEWLQVPVPRGFRTPSLRNLKYTAPYMHNGSFSDLKKVLEFYDDPPAMRIAGPYQIKTHFHEEVLQKLGLSDFEKSAIIDFLNTLSFDDGDFAEPMAANTSGPEPRRLGECLSCHNLCTGGDDRLGPPLEGIVGRRVASVPGYRYSIALSKKDFIWTERELDAWLKAPSMFVPGTRMTYAGLPERKERKELIRYLRRSSNACRPEVIAKSH